MDYWMKRWKNQRNNGIMGKWNNELVDKNIDRLMNKCINGLMYKKIKVF